MGPTGKAQHGVKEGQANGKNGRRSKKKEKNPLVETHKRNDGTFIQCSQATVSPSFVDKKDVRGSTQAQTQSLPDTWSVIISLEFKRKRIMIQKGGLQICRM